MEITRLEKRKIYEEIADQIKEQIISGKLLPGEKLLSSKELAERYQVGMSTIREALSALKAMNLIETRQGEGSFVRHIHSDDLVMPSFDSILMNKQTRIDLLEARKALEVANAGLAAVNRNQQDLAAFAEILSSMKDGIGDEEAGEKMDIAFHQTLARATHNAIMVRLIETISGQMEAAIQETRRLYLYGDKQVSKQLLAEHNEIFSAVKAGNAELAEEKMKQHLLHVEQILTPFIK